MSCAKTAEPIGMSFRVCWTRVSPKNYVLVGARIPQRKMQFGGIIGNIRRKPKFWVSDSNVLERCYYH